MGLYDERRSGRPRSVVAEDITALIRKTLTTKPTDGSTHWTCRSIAAETKISKSEVQRIWSTLGIAPHRQKALQAVQRSLLHGESVRHCRTVSGPTGCCDGALRRREEPDAGPGTYPNAIAHGPGICGRRNPRLRPSRHHDVVRRPGHCLRRDSGAVQEKAPPPGSSCSFSTTSMKTSLKNLMLHLIIDNYCTHKHKRVKRWLSQRPRYHVHFTPTYSSWAQPGRDLVQYHHAEGHQAGVFQIRERTHRKYTDLYGQLQPDL